MGQLAKTSLPSLQRVVARGRLFARLDRARHASAVWVSGPPGSGKTTLVASYVADRGLRCLWYRVDEGDGDLATFFHDLGAAAARGGARRLPLLTPEYRGGEAPFARNFFREIVRRRRVPFAIVLDDLQQARSGALHSALSVAVDQLPAGATAILVSRDEVPAPFARLVATGALSLIGAEELRLSRAEALAIGRAHAPHRTRAELVRACDRAAGWAAGLVLLVSGPSVPLGAHPDSAALFDYLATEIFDRADPEVRRVLVEAAIPPVLPIRLVDRLCSSKRAGQILGGLARRAYFATRRGGEDDGFFELHPLAREFLLSRGQAELTVEQLRSLRIQEAAVLAGGGHPEAAIALFVDARAWEEAGRLALELAPRLAETGRIAALGKWLGALPPEIRDRQPWLGYWYGLCRLPFDPVEARAHLARAHAAFEAADDVSGVYLSWCGVMDTFLFRWANFDQVAEWLDRFEAIRRRYPRPADPVLEPRATLRMLAVLAFLRLDSQALPALEDRAFEIVNDPSVPSRLRVEMGSWLVLECLYRGEVVQSEAVVRAMGSFLDAHVEPITVLIRLSTEAVHHWHAGDPSGAIRAVETGLALARDTGVHLWDFLLLLEGVMASLAQDDLPGARNYLARAEAAMGDGSTLDRGALEHNAGIVALRAGELERALASGRSVLDLSQRGGFRFGTVLGHLMLALSFTVQGDGDRARASLGEARRLGRAMRSSFVETLCELCAADLARRESDPAGAREHLARGFRLSREKHVAPDVWFSRGQLAALCALALEAGIEREHTLGLIRRLRLDAGGPDTRDLEEWPWPVRLRLLGGSELLVGGEPVVIPGGARRRPVDVLAAIVATGRPEPADQAVAGALWPDAEGDAAQHALETALYRLKRVVGDVVSHRGRRLSIDARRCWIDAAAFDSLLTRASASLERREIEAARWAAQRALRLYRGPFLVDREEPWVLAARERLRRKLCRTLAELGRCDSGPGGAPDMLDRAAAVDPALVATRG